MAAAILGNGVANANTDVTGYDKKNSQIPKRIFYGAYSGFFDAGKDATGGAVTVSESQDSPYAEVDSVYGGYYDSTKGSGSTHDNQISMSGGKVTTLYGGRGLSGVVESNTVTMTGGTANDVYGGYGLSGVVANTVTMTGGTANNVYGGTSDRTTTQDNWVEVLGGKVNQNVHGGYSSYADGNSNNNTVLITGGEIGGDVYGGQSTGDAASNNAVYITGGVIGGCVHGGYSPISATNNKIYLYGVGSSLELQGKTYDGQEIELGAVAAISPGTCSGNSIDIYGSGISAKTMGRRGEMQILNFHIAEAQLANGGDVMVTLTDAPLDLTTFLIPTEEISTPEYSLTFDAVSALEWKPGTSVTLVSDALGIKINENLLDKEYNIYQNGHPETMVGTATLKLEQGEGTTQFLKLVVPGNVPEPTTGTLGLLALAGLCARRRK